MQLVKLVLYKCQQLQQSCLVPLRPTTTTTSEAANAVFLISLSLTAEDI